MEQWEKSYEKEVEIYDSFAKYEDEGNKVLKRLLKDFSFKNKVVLDIGCGSGKYIKLLARRCKMYYALDISKPILNLAKKTCRGIKNVKYIHADAKKLPLNNDSVDVVFSTWGFPLEKKATTEVMRVLKKGGDLWVFANYHTGDFMKMRGPSEIEWEINNTEKAFRRNGLKKFDIVKTNFNFPSLKKAKEILGFMFREQALNYLEIYPFPKLKHDVIIYNKKKI